MASTVDRRDYARRRSTDRSISPVKDSHGLRRRSSPRRERSSTLRKSSPSFCRNRLPVNENTQNQTKLPKHERAKSPASDSSRSPSPRTKRLRRSQAEQEAEKLVNKDRGRRHTEQEDEKMVDRDRRKRSEREELDIESGRDRDESRDFSRNEKLLREKSDRGSSKALGWNRSVSPSRRRHESRHSSRSPSRIHKSGARDEVGRNSKEPENVWSGESDSVAKMKAATDALEAKEKLKPSFELSGKLAEETNRVRGVTLLFTEPADARKPNTRWRLYVFKAGEVLNEPLYVHRQSCYLFGRERKVADVPTDHPSCSKQHAVLQYRLVEKEQADGLISKQVRPYVMDLGSTNGTFINDNRIEPQRYYELFEKDTIKFGNSSREYVLLHENSAT